MSAEELIAALDAALLAGVHENVILRRIVGKSPNTQNIDVSCIARVDAASLEQIASGIAQADLNIIMSPTQINEAQWPGGTVPQLPPFNVDQRVPRENADKMIVRGRLRTVAFVDPKMWEREIVRINLRVTG